MQENKWQDKVLAKIWGMHKAAETNTLTFSGWPTGHVIDVLWGAGGKVVKAMQHDRLCAPLIRVCVLCQFMPAKFSACLGRH
jgi:hypothetical protein